MSDVSEDALVGSPKQRKQNVTPTFNPRLPFYSSSIALPDTYILIPTAVFYKCFFCLLAPGPSGWLDHKRFFCCSRKRDRASEAGMGMQRGQERLKHENVVPGDKGVDAGQRPTLFCVIVPIRGRPHKGAMGLIAGGWRLGCESTIRKSPESF